MWDNPPLLVFVSSYGFLNNFYTLWFYTNINSIIRQYKIIYTFFLPKRRRSIFSLETFGIEIYHSSIVNKLRHTRYSFRSPWSRIVKSCPSYESRGIAGGWGRARDATSVIPSFLSFYSVHSVRSRLFWGWHDREPAGNITRHRTRAFDRPRSSNKSVRRRKIWVLRFYGRTCQTQPPTAKLILFESV